MAESRVHQKWKNNNNDDDGKKKQKGSFKHFSRQGEHHLIFCVQTFWQLYNINPYIKKETLSF